MIFTDAERERFLTEGWVVARAVATEQHHDSEEVLTVGNSAPNAVKATQSAERWVRQLPIARQMRR